MSSSKLRLISSLLMLIALAFFAFAGLRSIHLPDAAGADAPPTQFSAARAMKYIAEIARRPHPLGSLEHLEVRNALIKDLNALEVKAEVQETTVVSRMRNAQYTAASVRNIVARINGTSNGKAVMLVAHYDSVATSPGANDDGNGVATILETVRALKAGPPLKHDVIVLLSDGEEAGMLGAKAFVEEHPWVKDVGLALNFEARGNTGPAILFETSANNGWLIGEFAKAVPYPVSSSLSYDIYRILPNDTDLSVFKEAGLAGLNFAYIDGVSKYHSGRDDISSVDERSLQHQGSYALALARHFGALDLEKHQEGNAVYFNIIGSGLIRYSGWLKFPFAGLVFVVFAYLARLALRKNRISLGKTGLGAAAFLGSLVAVALIVFLVWQIISWLGKTVGLFPISDLLHPEIYILSSIALTLAIISLFFNRLSRRIGVENLAVAGFFWWALLMLGSLFVLPGGSYLFTWPLLFSLIAYGFVITAQEQEKASLKRVIILAIGAVPAVVICAPLIQQLFIALGLKAMVPISALVVLLTGLLILQFDILSSFRTWFLPGSMAVLSLGLIIVGSLSVRYDSNNPKVNHVFYSLNADSGRAVWATVDPKPDEWTSQFFPAGAKKGALTEYVLARYDGFLSREAVATQLLSPNISILDDKTDAQARTVTLRLTSARQAPVLMVTVDPEVGILMAEVNGKPLQGLAAYAQADHQNPLRLNYYGVPPEGIELRFKVKLPGALKIRVLDQSYGLPEIEGQPIIPRPNDTIPSPFQPYTESTLVSKIFNL